MEPSTTTNGDTLTAPEPSAPRIRRVPLGKLGLGRRHLSHVLAFRRGIEAELSAIAGGITFMQAKLIQSAAIGLASVYRAGEMLDKCKRGEITLTPNEQVGLWGVIGDGNKQSDRCLAQLGLNIKADGGIAWPALPPLPAAPTMPASDPNVANAIPTPQTPSCAAGGAFPQTEVSP